MFGIKVHYVRWLFFRQKSNAVDTTDAQINIIDYRKKKPERCGMVDNVTTLN